MTTTWKQKPLTIFLICLVLAVWGVIGFQVYSAMNELGAVDESRALNARQRSSPNMNFAYSADIRDPFVYHQKLARHRWTSVRDTARAEAWHPPPYRFSGILGTKTMRTALLEAENGAAYFLKEGDTLGGIRILKIYQDEVLFVFNKKKSVWALDGRVSPIENQ